MQKEETLIQPTILSGFMELLPNEQLVFNSMLQAIQKSYESFGFTPLDTPIIEKSEVLLAKAGAEATKQTYSFKKGDNDLALRFDLTVPLARYVSQHMHELIFPFKRYQIGKVYRGEKPQKGRFREFYQCDIDVIGKDELGLETDAEIVAVTYSTFKNLGIGKFLIRINNRKILSGFIKSLGIGANSVELLRVIDKQEKMPKEKFRELLEELIGKKQNVDKLLSLLAINGNSKDIFKKLEDLGVGDKTYLEGLTELKEVVKYVNYYGVPESNWEIDLSIARGLEYYTGTVYETTLVDYPQIGSVCSGGRYDDLANYYTEQKLPGVGISIGLTRLFYQLNELKLIKTTAQSPTKILVIPLTESLSEVFAAANSLREISIPTEVNLTNKGLGKKLDYANKMGIRFVLIIGDDELKTGIATVKDMESGEQTQVKLSELQDHFKNLEISK